MAHRLILASGSEIRQKMLGDAGVVFKTVVKSVNEDTIRRTEEAAGSPPDNIAETLAVEKAMKVSQIEKDALVIGCDQILAFDQQIFTKPISVEHAHQQLCQLRGNTHQLFSAAAVCQNGVVLWRYTGQVSLEMREFSDAFLDGYLVRNWNSIRHSVGGYKLEEEGIRLFLDVKGDYFTVLGMPLLPLLAYLVESGELQQ
ncbi:MAG: Maf family protein [Rhodobacterales bacterium]|nr:Maf family protein [Rhodobacterales bacterium]